MVMGFNGVVSAGHPLASQAGLAVLKGGGNAFDAAFATAAVLSVVKPDMNGLGGDAFGLLYSARHGEIIALNGSGPAPALAKPAEYQARPPRPREGPRAATVPGAVASWFSMLERFGTRSPGYLLKPAIAYAGEGFPVSLLLAGSIARYSADLARFPTTASLFLPGGRPLQPFTRLIQPGLAGVLERLAARGAADFYQGETAQALTGQYLQASDLADYRPEWKKPLQIAYKGWTIYGQPPVSQGHVLLEALNIIKEDHLAQLGFQTEAAVHLMVEATRLAFDDRLKLAGDPAFTGWNPDEILAPHRASQHRLSIGPAVTLAAPAKESSSTGETTYFAVVDREGNWVSFIQSLFHAFGSGEMLGETGIILNDRLTGFSLDPASPNYLAPGKRPIHTLNACLLFKAGRPYAALGTPGSDGQVQTNLQVITHLLDYNLSVQAAIEAPRWRWSPASGLTIENRFPPATLAGLARRGHKLVVEAGWSDKLGGVQAILTNLESGVLMGGADPRREGYAAGW